MTAPGTGESTGERVEVEHVRTRRILLLIGILVIAGNMRPSLTTVGPLIDVIRRSTGLSSAEVGVLNTLPLLAFSGVSAVAPRWARRFGIEPLMFAAVAAIALGTVLRSLPSVVLLFGGTALLGAGIACLNVILPALIKRDYPARIPAMTAAYVVTLSAVAAIASGVASPIADSAPGGWRTSLGCWAIPAVIALGVWAPQLRARTRPPRVAHVTGLSRSALAWQVSLFMGAQSFVFYSVITWLPNILQDNGFSNSGAGWELFLYQLMSLATAAVVPGVARRFADQRLVASATSVCAFVAFTGLDFAPSLATAWVILGGLASGAALTLALSFLGLRGGNSAEVSALSGMAQSIGYLISAAGPILVGFLHDASSAWRLSLILISSISFLQFVVGFGAGRVRTVGDTGRLTTSDVA